MNILITGGAGFIGSHLTDRLVEQGHQVTVLDSLEPQVHDAKPDHLNPDATYRWGNVMDRDLVLELLQDNHLVYHLAAQVGVGQSMYEIERYVRDNTLGTARLLELLVNEEHDVGKVVVAASMSSYGEGRYQCADCGLVDPPLRSDEQLEAHEWEVRCPDCGEPVRPVPTDEAKARDSNSVYAITKKDQEELCLAVGRAYGLPVVATRFFNVYGPRQALSNPYTGVTAIFASRIKNDHAPVVFEDGRQTRDFISVRDVAAALDRAGQRSGADGQAINVGTGQPQTILGVAETLIDLYGKDLTPEVQDRFRAGDIRHCYADTTRIQAALDWKPKVSFEEGMADLVAWSEGVEAQDRFEDAHQELVKRGLVER